MEHGTGEKPANVLSEKEGSKWQKIRVIINTISDLNTHVLCTAPKI